MSVAPSSAANDTRGSNGSTAITRDAPSRLALATCTMPTGPMPTTATVSPERKPPGRGILATRSRLCVTANNSVSTATFVGRPSGTLNTGVPRRT